jgi:hypothetical protein
MSNHMQVESSFELSSDHSPVIATMSTYAISKSTTPNLSQNKLDQLSYIHRRTHKLELENK